MTSSGATARSWNDELAASEGEARAGVVSRIASGAAPIGPLADEWLGVKPLKPRQNLDYRRAVRPYRAPASGGARRAKATRRDPAVGGDGRLLVSGRRFERELRWDQEFRRDRPVRIGPI
jgi:hypothetical protein